MNKEVRKAVTNLMVTMENEICEDCELARMMSEMAQDVRCEFILASKLRNHDECIDVLNEMLDCYDNDEYDEAIECLRQILKKAEGKLSRYILGLVMSGSETRAVYFLEAFFDIGDSYEEDDYDEDDEDDKYEPLVNEGYL